MDQEIRFVGEMTRVDVKPGDVFVVHCEMHLSQQSIADLTAHVENKLGAKVLVLPVGLRLGVARQEHAAPADA